MSPRKTSRKAKQQYPPAPFAEDDVAALENDDFEGLSQEAIDEYLAYERMTELHLEDGEDEYVNDDNHDSLQSTAEGYEQQEPPLMPSVEFHSVLVESPQRPAAPLQHCAVPAPPPPTIVFRTVPHIATVASPPVPEARAWSQFVGRAPRDFVSNHQRYVQPGLASTNGYFENLPPSGVMPGGYTYGVGGVDHVTRPHHTMPTRNRGSIGRSPFAIPRVADRDLALREEPIELFEMWADTFSRSRRIEEDVATLRDRLRLLHQFYYRS